MTSIDFIATFFIKCSYKSSRHYIRHSLLTFMTKLTKIFEKFQTNPKNLHYADIEKILIASGCIKILAKGSHIKFKHPLAKFDLIIPIHNHDCKEFYKKSALKFIKTHNLDIFL